MYQVKDKKVIQIILDQFSDSYSYWENLNHNEYQKYKTQIVDTVISRIKTYLPSISDIECLDIATPLTLNRYVNASRGSYMAYYFTPKKMPIMNSGKLKGLKNFYLSGQYVNTPGGLPMALSAGKYAINWITYYNRPIRTFIKSKFVKINK